MEQVFPCGAKGRAEFCPGICQYGKFCKIVKKQTEVPRGLQEPKKEAPKQEEKRDNAKVELYY